MVSEMAAWLGLKGLASPTLFTLGISKPTQFVIFYFILLRSIHSKPFRMTL